MQVYLSLIFSIVIPERKNILLCDHRQGEKHATPLTTKVKAVTKKQTKTKSQSSYNKKNRKTESQNRYKKIREKKQIVKAVSRFWADEKFSWTTTHQISMHIKNIPLVSLKNDFL